MNKNYNPSNGFVVKISIITGLFIARLGSAQAAPPRLTVVLVVDQMRADYLERFTGEYLGGFARLVRGGAIFTHARHGHVPTETAPGHAALLTGCFPSQHGVINNYWWDRGSGKEVYAVDDPDHGRSPVHELCPALGDLLKAASPESKVVSISGKDRAAILMGGHKPDLALWYDSSSGQFISSGYYGRLPDWVWNWDDKLRIPPDQRQDLQAMPLLDAMTLQLAKYAVEKENLGNHAVPDLLAVSLSATDYIGHKKGPESLEMRNQLVSLDLELALFFDFLDKTVGPGNYILALSSDHGVLPIPESEAGKAMHASRLSDEDFLGGLGAAFSRRFGSPVSAGAKWILNVDMPNIYLNMLLAKQMSLEPAMFRREAADILRKDPRVAAVYRPEDFLPSGSKAAGPYAEAYRLSYNQDRSGDLMVLLKEGVLYSRKDLEFTTSHGTPYDYDSHVPLVLMGSGVRPGRYDRAVLAEDLAPTLGRLLGLDMPPKQPARVLVEALAVAASSGGAR